MRRRKWSIEQKNQTKREMASGKNHVAGREEETLFKPGPHKVQKRSMPSRARGKKNEVKVAPTPNDSVKKVEGKEKAAKGLREGSHRQSGLKIKARTREGVNS